MKNNSIKILLATLCFSAMNTKLLGMDFSDYTSKILHKNKINHELDRLDDKLHQQQSVYIRAAIRCVGYDNDDDLDNSLDMAKACAIGVDIQTVRMSRNTLNNQLAQGATIDNATQAVQVFINRQCDTEKSAIQALLNTFSRSFDNR
jgi:hypothetical protein